MKKRLVLLVLVVTIGALIVAAVTLRGPLRASPSRDATPSSISFNIGDEAFVAHRLNQPNGSFAVQILDAATDQVLIQSSRSANPMMRWSLVEEGGNVWFYSSDFGMLVFTRASGAWEELVWLPTTETATLYPIPDDLFSRLSPRDQDHLARFRGTTGNK